MDQETTEQGSFMITSDIAHTVSAGQTEGFFHRMFCFLLEVHQNKQSHTH